MREPQTVGQPRQTLQSWLSKRRAPRDPLWVFWVYIVIIATIEAGTALTRPQFGLTLYAGLLVLLTLHSSMGRSDDGRKLALALTLVPLIRMLALLLPLLDLPIVTWYPVVAVPMLLIVSVVVYQTRLPIRTLGLQSTQRALHLMMISGGFGLGAVLYGLRFSQTAVDPIDWGPFVLPMVLLVMLAGFTEEIIFRGLVQTIAGRLMGPWSLIYGAVLFAVLQIGYLSISLVLFALVLGLLFAQIVSWSGSLLGVALVHGMMNVTALIFLPILDESNVVTDSTFVASNVTGDPTPLIIFVLLVCMSVSLCGILMALGYLSAPS